MGLTGLNATSAEGCWARIRLAVVTNGSHFSYYAPKPAVSRLLYSWRGMSDSRLWLCYLLHSSFIFCNMFYFMCMCMYVDSCAKTLLALRSFSYLLHGLEGLNETAPLRRVRKLDSEPNQVTATLILFPVVGGCFVPQWQLSS